MIEPLDFSIQLPPSQPPVTTTDQDPPLPMFLFVHPSQPPQQPPQQPFPPVNTNQDSDPKTKLTMSLYSTPPQQPPQLPLPPPHAPRRNRRKPSHAPREGKSPIIAPPFPWATDHRAQVHNLNYLTENQITTISGDVECKRCEKRYKIEYNLEQKYQQVSSYVAMHMHEFHDRAPKKWMSPTLPTCKFCHQENCVKPLKYFCKHTGNHRTGAKDRVLFLTYLELCKQVSPDRWTL
ncbi:hypothetical protein HanHA300_Chr01g0014451 [Helianthus annuus]|nr:hypothetical protein HanHA300_Chr01g0014451 [Helianthus annuus]